MDVTTKAVIETISDAGYSVMTGADSDGNSIAEATSEQTGERFVVRADSLFTASAEPVVVWASVNRGGNATRHLGTGSVQTSR